MKSRDLSVPCQNKKRLTFIKSPTNFLVGDLTIFLSKKTRAKMGFFGNFTTRFYNIGLLTGFRTSKAFERLAHFSTPIFNLFLVSNPLVRKDSRHLKGGKSARFFNNIYLPF